MTALRRALHPLRRIYYGWVLLVALALAQVTSWGILYYAFPVFLTPMRHDLGWSTAQVTAGYSLALLLSAAAAPFVGLWVDRRGPRLLMTIGSCVAAVLVLAWARVGSLSAFYVVWAGIGLAMATVLYEPAFVVVANWFVRQRGRALTVLTFIGGFASIVYIPFANWLVDVQGWRMALVTLAVVLAVGTIPLHALLLRRRPADLGLRPDGASAPSLSQETAGSADQKERSIPIGEALRGLTFWALALSFFLVMLSASAITIHFIPYLIGRGYSPAFAAGAAAMIGVVALPGRAIFTPIGDILPRQAVTAAIFLTQTISLVALLMIPGMAGVVLFVALFGLGFGAITPARAALVAESYGPEHYGRINGFLAMLLMGARALAPVGVGVLYGLFGSYVPAFWMLAGGSALATVVVAVGAPRPQPAATSVV